MWLSYFNTPMSIMLTKKRNICLETIGALLLFPHSDISEVRCLTSALNEHIYGMWKIILRVFNMEHLIRIVQKNNFLMECIFESGITVSRPNTTFKGNQSTLSDFNENLMMGVIYFWTGNSWLFLLDLHLYCCLTHHCTVMHSVRSWYLVTTFQTDLAWSDGYNFGGECMDGTFIGDIWGREGKQSISHALG